MFGHRRHIGRGARPIMVTSPVRHAAHRIVQPAKRKTVMKRSTLYLSSTLAVVLSVAALGISAAVDVPRTLMAPSDYNSAKRAIESEARVTYARCRSQQGSSRELCRAEARAGERVKIADLQARYHGTVAAADEARAARFKASYDVARARCTVEGEAQQPDCLRAARDENARAMANAKLAST
jgi:hypothetical protein